MSKKLRRQYIISIILFIILVVLNTFLIKSGLENGYKEIYLAACVGTVFTVVTYTNVLLEYLRFRKSGE